MKEVTAQKNNTQLASPFITAYFVGGFPTKKESIQIITQAVQAGLNAIEIGFPSKNPYLDGDTIKKAHKKSEDIFASLEEFIDYLKDVREAISIPIWIMGYEADLLRDQAYIKLADSSFIDGFVIPDLDNTQLNDVQKQLSHTDVNIIPVINNGMSNGEINTWVEHAEVVYCQLYAGKTGHAFTNTEGLPDFYNRMRRITNAKLMAGFGIKSQDIAEEIFDVGYDGIVVGSEFVRLIAAENEVSLYQLIDELVQSKKK